MTVENKGKLILTEILPSVQKTLYLKVWKIYYGPEWNPSPEEMYWNYWDEMIRILGAELDKLASHVMWQNWPVLTDNQD